VKGATSDLGLRTNASYLVQWSFIRWLKEHGLVHYDLNGIDPVSNPGTYHFKRGLAGRCGRDVAFLGRFQVSDSSLSPWIVNAAENLLSRYRRFVTAGRTRRPATPRC
jgi:lipid II:glycine glycyltransferase (peptidoglycan interpeptide bridge formation enzyme)